MILQWRCIVLCFIVTLAVKSARDMVWLIFYLRNYACVQNKYYMISREYHEFSKQLYKICEKNGFYHCVVTLLVTSKLKRLVSIILIVCSIIFTHQNTFFIYWEKVNMKHEFIFPNPVHVREYGSFFLNVGIFIYCSNSVWKIHVYLNLLVFYHYVYM